LREIEKLHQKFNTQEQQMKTKDEAVATAETTLKQERLSRTFGAALLKAEVFPQGASDALAVLLSEIKDVEIADNGVVRASYGESVIDEAPETIAKKFLEDRPYFASAKVGGAGTQKPTGRPSSTKDIQEMSTDQLWEEAGPDPSAA
jgi:hypothetical protein